jgi:hypothetical protein
MSKMAGKKHIQWAVFNQNLYVANWQCATITEISLNQKQGFNTSQLGEVTAYLKVNGSKIFGFNENDEKVKYFY